MNDNKSVATIDAPEFIEVTNISPMISKCQIKVFYLGKNRNGSYIDKETAIKMADTLRGNPIVAAYRSDKEDFGDHGEVIHIEDGEISFSCKTVPYGFVATDAEVWFQKFTDTDDFGNEVVREYLMTTGYLWTGQYEELNSVIAEGKGQSMELDGDTLSGHWAFDDKTGYEFFIINDATITKLCILGDDVEPCFEGASVTSMPENNFSHNEAVVFKHSIQKMLFQLKDALEQENEGGLNYMDNEQDVEVLEETPETIVEETVVEEEIVEEEVAALREFRLQAENEKKDSLIAKYFMLTDEQKADVVANKSTYSYEDIEAKLALIYVNANAASIFSLEDEEEEEEVLDSNPAMMFSLDTSDDFTTSDLLRALRNTKH